jgi:carbohydrate kinase (thermoresistant glucokinase family)
MTSSIAAIVVMGVAGAGKSTVGQALAARLGCAFRDADSFHPPANIAKMSEGVPLSDEDRWPWLDAIAAWIAELRAAGMLGVVTCSALKRRYRDVLMRGGQVRLVYLKGDMALIGGRLAARKGHFMPTALLQSQFDALEEPTTDEAPITVSVEGPPDEIVTRIVDALALSAPHPQRRSG